MNLILIVKGPKFVAAKAAASRGIPFAFRREKNGETIGLVGEQFRDKVDRWYGEPPIAPPYPEGTLLHYSEA